MNPASLWDQRYTEDQNVYGGKPNEFLVSQIDRLPKGKLLSLGEGQGKNAVYLAKLGFNVSAVDISSVGLQQAAEYAAREKISIQTFTADLAAYSIEQNYWDCIISIFCHLPLRARTTLFTQIEQALHPGGVFLLEAYAPDQLQYGTGGPHTLELLADLQELKQYIHGLQLIVAREIEREVDEGLRHHGLAKVQQILAVKS